MQSGILFFLQTDADCSGKTQKKCQPLQELPFFPQNRNGKKFKENDTAPHHQRIGNGTDPQPGKKIHPGINKAETAEKFRDLQKTAVVPDPSPVEMRLHILQKRFPSWEFKKESPHAHPCRKCRGAPYAGYHFRRREVGWQIAERLCQTRCQKCKKSKEFPLAVFFAVFTASEER